MKIKRKVNEYLKNGSPVFVYALSGSDKELKQYTENKLKQGFNVVNKDDNEVIFWSRNVLPDDTEMRFKANNTDIYPVTDLTDVATRINDQSLKTQGTLNGIMQFAGLTKSQMVERALSAL